MLAKFKHHLHLTDIIFYKKISSLTSYDHCFYINLLCIIML